jgi:hypothetical protein
MVFLLVFCWISAGFTMDLPLKKKPSRWRMAIMAAWEIPELGELLKRQLDGRCLLVYQVKSGYPNNSLDDINYKHTYRNIYI